jgi:hypothetical protein
MAARNPNAAAKDIDRITNARTTNDSVRRVKATGSHREIVRATPMSPSLPDVLTSAHNWPVVHASGAIVVGNLCDSLQDIGGGGAGRPTRLTLN